MFKIKTYIYPENGISFEDWLTCWENNNLELIQVLEFENETNGEIGFAQVLFKNNIK